MPRTHLFYLGVTMMNFDNYLIPWCAIQLGVLGQDLHGQHLQLGWQEVWGPIYRFSRHCRSKRSQTAAVVVCSHCVALFGGKCEIRHKFAIMYRMRLGGNVKLNPHWGLYIAFTHVSLRVSLSWDKSAHLRWRTHTCVSLGMSLRQSQAPNILSCTGVCIEIKSVSHIKKMEIRILDCKINVYYITHCSPNLRNATYWSCL